TSQGGGGCAERSEGADGVVRPAKCFRRTDHLGASRLPSSARRGIQESLDSHERCKCSPAVSSHPHRPARRNEGPVSAFCGNLPDENKRGRGPAARRGDLLLQVLVLPQ